MKLFHLCTVVHRAVVIFLLISEQHVSASVFRKHGSDSRSSNPPTHLSTSESSDGNATSFKQPTSKDDRLITCSTPMVAGSRSRVDTRCPDACPFYAQDRTVACTFHCVTADKCTEFNHRKPIADKELGICRKPNPGPGCATWYLDETERCKTCQWDWYLNSDGQCIRRYQWVCWLVLSILLILVALVVAWIVDLACRPSTNEEVLKAGLEERESMKLHGKIVEGFESHNSIVSVRHISKDENLFPLSTNLCTRLVAGPGTALHFNFQVAIIVWALMIGLGWVVVSVVLTGRANMMRDSNKLEFGTPRDNCILVAWGHKKQRQLNQPMILYLSIIYVSSFILALVHSVRQLRTYQALDDEHKTMRDYAAKLVGLPALPGSRDVESDLVMQIESKIGFDIVGVSIAWDYTDRQDQVTRASISEFTPRRTNPTVTHEPPTGFRKKLYDAESSLIAKMIEVQEDDKKEDVPALLAELKTSNTAFVVFHTEADKFRALDAVKSGGLEFEGSSLTLERVECGPGGINWQNFHNENERTLIWMCSKGLGSILVGLVTWALLFYGPYAVMVYNFNYENGAEPGAMYDFAFSMVVVAGNQIMYQICDKFAVDLQLRYSDSKEVAYMLSYLAATSLNVLLDYVGMYWISWQIMEGLNFHTHDGRHLYKVGMFPEGFQTFPLQLQLARNIFAYAWPSTYLVPLALEPFMTNLLPLQLAKLLVRTHEEVTLKDATCMLTPFTPMDMGRYADILLNVVILLSMFWFPGGYIAKLSVLLAGCHLLMCVWDAYRVLRIVPKFSYSSMDIDWWSQALLAPCCGFIASALAYHVNNAVETSGKVWGVLFESFAAFAIHTIVHVLLLVYLVPCFGKQHEDLDDEATYDELCADVDSNWFNANAVHCLRKQYLKIHSPRTSAKHTFEGSLRSPRDALKPKHSPRDTLKPKHT